MGNTGRGLVGSLNNCYFIIARGVSLIDIFFVIKSIIFLLVLVADYRADILASETVWV